MRTIKKRNQKGDKKPRKSVVTKAKGEDIGEGGSGQ